MVWKTIPSFPEYQANHRGLIRRFGGWPLSPSICSGYLKVSLWRANKGHGRYVHRLVCEAFHGAPPHGKMDAAHKNRDRHDNRPRNLRWATRAENEADKREHGIDNIGSRNGRSKLTEAQVIEIRERVIHLPTSSGGCRIKKGALPALAAEYGVTAGCLSQIIAGTRWTHL